MMLAPMCSRATWKPDGPFYQKRYEGALGQFADCSKRGPFPPARGQGSHGGLYLARVVLPVWAPPVVALPLA